MIKIREANVDDVEVFYQLILDEARFHNQEQYVRTSVDELRRSGFGTDRKFGVLLAEFDGHVAGYVSYTMNYSIWLGESFMMIDDVFVSEQYRGRKVGEALMNAARDLARKAGCTRARWGVQSHNHDAIRFYRRLGAELITKGHFTWTF